MDASFTVRNHRSGTSEVIELAGELDMATAPQLEAVLDEMLIIPDSIVVDVERLTFIDSSGLRLLLRASHLVDGRIHLRGCSEQIAKLFDISGVSGAFTLSASTEGSNSRVEAVHSTGAGLTLE